MIYIKKNKIKKSRIKAIESNKKKIRTIVTVSSLILELQNGKTLSSNTNIARALINFDLRTNE